MKKYYITSDKVGEFVARMYAAGIEVKVDPNAKEIVIKKYGGYEWVHIFDKTSFDDLCNAFLPTDGEPINEE